MTREKFDAIERSVDFYWEERAAVYKAIESSGLDAHGADGCAAARIAMAVVQREIQRRRDAAGVTPEELDEYEYLTECHNEMLRGGEA